MGSTHTYRYVKVPSKPSHTVKASASFSGNEHGNQTLTVKLYVDDTVVQTKTATTGDVQPSNFSLNATTNSSTV